MKDNNVQSKLTWIIIGACCVCVWFVIYQVVKFYTKDKANKTAVIVNDDLHYSNSNEQVTTLNHYQDIQHKDSLDIYRFNHSNVEIAAECFMTNTPILTPISDININDHVSWNDNSSDCTEHFSYV